MNNTSRNSRPLRSSNFKGYPLIDFIQNSVMDLEDVISRPALLKAVSAYVRHYQPSDTPDNSIKDTCNLPKSTVNISNDNELFQNNDEFFDSSKTPPSFEDSLNEFLEGLYLGKFESNVFQPVKTKPPLRYSFEIGFNTDKETGFVLENPLDTLITFEPKKPIHAYDGYVKPDTSAMPTMVDGSGATVKPSCDNKPVVSIGRAATVDFSKTFYDGREPNKLRNNCDINFRIIVDDHNRLQELNIYGETLKVHLSKGLVQPVKPTQSGQWERTGDRLKFNIGERIITLKKNKVPSFGGAIELDNIAVVISSSKVIGRLNRVNLGGTPQKPLIVFDDVEII